MKRLLILAIVLRLLVAGFLFHPDIKTINFQASFLKTGVFNIYTYLVDNKKSLTLKDDFVYFPLTYFTVGGYQWAASGVLGKGFDSWLADAGSYSAVENPNIFKYLVTLKLPYLVLDVLIAFLLMKFFEDKEEKKKAFVFWLFNPFTIIIIYVFSNIDIFSVILTVLSFLMIKKQKLFSAAIFLGLASGFKLYPLLFIPFLFLAGRNLKEKAILSVTPLITFGIIILPFISSAFFQSALVSGLTTGIFTSDFATLALSLLFFYVALFDKKINLFNYWVSMFLIIFSFALFHVQWLLWIVPFLVILCIKKPDLSRLIFFLGAIAFVVPLLFQDRYMSISLFRIYSTWFDMLPTPFTLVQKVYDPLNFQFVFHSILAAGNLVMIYKLFKEDDVNDNII
ncbi:MAG: Mannosyltransferase [Microgenomates group bacterium GW2011_GWC1_39_7b]|uniref:Mannosyltransferase n=2 Tax=Candidatus Woeseibacteriota TaxID=1752722 RepID=A0A0G0PR47_9BACT|nr:MAG: Mannosyltransferase [Candidatus Woesebacteria bacterium GW2011_GWB1_39_10]KKR27056.1 MAG: Mannosyltransferase [Microgenomates group bacterium GW2011_GWC1_39_7b]KKS90841.1 MAG: Mannosyltransferase [Candidatus Woesebacteria bacterium GW2011_GWA1_43_12]